MSSDQHQRIMELEIQLAHVQRLYEQLNEVVTAQTMEFDRMARQMAQLKNQLTQLKAKPLPPIDPLDEKPPHY